MPAHDKSNTQFSDRGPDSNNFLGSESDDDALWLLLNAYADGEATPEEILQVEAILRTHPEVSRDFAFLQLTSESVRDFSEVEPPVSLSSAIFAATTHRVTWKQRVLAWWSPFARSFAPVPLRIGLAGGALTAGILAFVFWPRHHDNIVVRPVITPNTAQRAVPAPKTSLAGKTGPKNFKPFVMPSPGPDPVVPLETPKTFDPNAIAKVDLPPVQPVAHMKIKPLIGDGSNQGTIARHDVAKLKSDSPGGLVFTPARAGNEERHMALNSSDSGNAGAQSLGPDVNEPTPEDMRMDPATMADMGMPPAHDDPPPARVSTVSYKPGSISESVRPAPPTLAMRANEAIRREQELQKYGGYGKDAVNNIQRGEVGFSLVGGKF